MKIGPLDPEIILFEGLLKKKNKKLLQAEHIARMAGMLHELNNKCIHGAFAESSNDK